MKILVVIPARYASTRFPGKPLVDIFGISMIERVYMRASEAFTDVFVATDDERIFNKVKEFGGNIVMTSIHHQSGTDRCYEAMQLIEKDHNKEFDILINVQGDEPFVDLEQLKQLVCCFENEDVEIATLIKRISSSDELFDENTPKVVIDAKKFALYFSRSPIPFFRGVEKLDWLKLGTFYKHIGLYAYKKEALKKISNLPQSSLESIEKLEQLRWLENGLRIVTSETNKESYSIDLPSDIEKLKKKNN